MKRSISTFILGALLVALAIPSEAAFAQSVDELLNRIQATYQGGATVQGSITQTVESPFNDRTQRISGTIYMQGDQYRVETQQQTVVTNGETVWIYSPADNQVIINDYVEDETAFSPSDFFMNYRERYEASLSGTQQIAGATHHVLDLEPRERDTFFQNVRVWLRDSDDVVTRLEVEDIDGTVMRFDMDDVRFNASVDTETFRFNPPSGAEVVDLRS